MKKIAFALFALACIAGPAAAENICPEHAKTEWMTEEAITKAVTDKGYVVGSVQEEDGCWEVKGTKDGANVEAYFDPVSGELVKSK